MDEVENVPLLRRGKISGVQYLMTRSRQKDTERFFVEEATKCLGKKWLLGQEDRERPDFIVTEDGHQFGLEVVQIFTGDQGQHGSLNKRGESENQKAVNAIRAEYEKYDDTPLVVRFVGGKRPDRKQLCPENRNAVVPALLEMKFSAKPIGYQKRFEVDKGFAPDKGLHSEKLIVYVTRWSQGHSNWFYVNDRTGFVNKNTVERITDEIKNKANKLNRYRANTNLDDIRLLIVADRIMNSGKMSLEVSPELDLCGFQAVYFFSYPESVTVWDMSSGVAVSLLDELKDYHRDM